MWDVSETVANFWRQFLVSVSWVLVFIIAVLKELDNWIPSRQWDLHVLLPVHCERKQEVKVIWQKAPHGGPIPRLGVTPGGRNLYHW